MVPSNFTISELITVVRKKLPQLTKEQNLTLFAQGKYILKQNNLLVDMFEKHKDSDGFLYVVYTGENTLGCEQI